MIDLEKLKNELRCGAPASESWHVLASRTNDERRRAADAIESLQRENTIFRAERDQARAQREFCVKMLTRIQSFITPEDVTLPDGRRFEFNNPAIEHDMLRALSKAIRAVPDELKKAESAQPEDEWYGY